MITFIKKHLSVFLLVISFSSTAAVTPDVLLANVYDADKVNINDYLVSEKYDGIRAIWTGNKLVTRNGHLIHAPVWFTAPLPDVWLDGELWTKRQDFANLSGIVRTHQPNDSEWHKVSYQVFDMPDATLPFSQRYQNYASLVTQINAKHIRAVKQRRFTDNHQLSLFMDELVAKGAEGVMLHLALATHKAGRSDALLKLKPYLDAEAVVVAHFPGKGKYKNMLGALKVRNAEGVEFKIGSGFSDKQRQFPPAIGSTITYKYHGFTKNGLPRFASFLHERVPL
ncbi:DNA ligase [Pseudoalteromonas sp. bablab_jr011]|jgi:DNA ligase-1|uniref:DNA ligase n=1 Tax=Pseudoalteromonas sp. bablab_jr011 TaxID=2755062 RepID=UPI0018F29DE7|nr:DNA ligase [Pseudoalteromonas sp. bablab_jr011]